MKAQSEAIDFQHEFHFYNYVIGSFKVITLRFKKINYFLSSNCVFIIDYWCL